LRTFAVFGIRVRPGSGADVLRDRSTRLESRPRDGVKRGQMTTGLTNFSPDDGSVAPLHLPIEANDGGSVENESGSAGDNPATPGDTTADSWRGEVAARLQRYRTRRKPSSPRYPSLLLPFDPPEHRYRASPPKAIGSNALDSNPRPLAEPNRVDERKSNLGNEAWPSSPLHDPLPNLLDLADVSGKVIEFPRSAAIPEFRTSDLADPVIDRPRIVEAPEVLPPPPALGGMLIEPARNAARDSGMTLSFRRLQPRFCAVWRPGVWIWPFLVPPWQSFRLFLCA
jgi:hypothetical protein